MLLQKPRADLRVVVNMAASTHEGERTYKTLRKACESFLNTVPPLAGIVRRDAKVKESIRHQSAFLMRHPNTEAAADVEALARRLIEMS
jgi:flagellar biosynthesis protein FlhG